MNVPADMVLVLTMLRPVIARPTPHRLLRRVLSTSLTTGHRTVARLLRIGYYQAQGPVASSHRVCSQR